jgi:hypothetical protein
MKKSFAVFLGSAGDVQNHFNGSQSLSRRSTEDISQQAFPLPPPSQSLSIMLTGFLY